MQTAPGSATAGCSRRDHLVVAGLLALLVALQLGQLWHNGLTSDEPDHLRYGLGLLHGDSRRFDDSKMPVTALNTLPVRLAARELRAGGARGPLLSRYEVSEADLRRLGERGRSSSSAPKIEPRRPAGR